jgi:hypothetical protein
MGMPGLMSGDGKRAARKRQYPRPSSTLRAPQRRGFRLREPVSTRLEPRRSGGLPVLVHAVSRSAWGLRPRRGLRRLAILSPPAGVAFSLTGKHRHPDLSFSRLNTLPADASVYASLAASQRPAQDSRSGRSRCSFPVGLSHPLQTCRLIPAHPVLDPTGEWKTSLVEAVGCKMHSEREAKTEIPVQTA